MKFYKRALAAPIMGMMAVSMAWGGTTANAQSTQPTGLSPDLAVYNACSAADVITAAVKALNITPVELRKDIVSGQSLQAIAQSKSVDLQTVNSAIQAARKAEIDQAVTDGILTQDEATALESGNVGPQGNQGAPVQQGSQSNGLPPAPQGGPDQQGNQPGGLPPQGAPNGQAIQNQLPDINNLYFLLQNSNPAATQNAQGPRGGRMGANFNVVQPYLVSAQALNMKCSDLVKTLVSGKTIAAVATDHKVDVSTVTTALTKAYTDALAQDVTNGIITQAQSDQVSKNLDQAVANFVNNAGPMMGPRHHRGQ